MMGSQRFAQDRIPFSLVFFLLFVPTAVCCNMLSGVADMRE